MVKRRNEGTKWNGIRVGFGFVMAFLRKLSTIEGIKFIHITTNGVLTAQLIPELKSIGVKSIKLSLDTLDGERFKEMTRRNELSNVLETLDRSPPVIRIFECPFVPLTQPFVEFLQK